jgi:hypothetical protein
MANEIVAHASAVIAAPSQDIYRVLSDYESEHPKIVPKPFFEAITVKEGGRGAGTVVETTVRVWGTRRRLQMVVSEPIPGRVLREEDLTSQAVTTFTLTPIDRDRTRVEIETRWAPRSGLQGLVERFMNPRIARPLYEEELLLLARYLEGQRA